MIAQKKICVVTGSRAEYGLLCPLLNLMKQDQHIYLQIVATNMHLSPEFGLTYKDIENDGFIISKKLEMLLSTDTPLGIVKSIGLATIGFADTFSDLSPDAIVLLGDRYELLAAAESALIMKIPIFHIAGGDITEGAFDEAIRHSITKMAQLHFVTNQKSWQCVRQLGEDPSQIFNFGSLGLDVILNTSLLSQKELERELNFTLLQKNLLITFHPETLDEQMSHSKFQNILKALDKLGNKIGLIFTMPNSDPEGRSIMRMINDFLTNKPNARAYTSLGQLKYLSTMSLVDAIVGNSSSGICEAPSFQIPTVNIGNRQKGRIQAESVINSSYDSEVIFLSIEKALKMNCSHTVNPYGDGHTAPKILFKMKEFLNTHRAISKKFHLL